MDELRTPEQVAELQVGTVIVNAPGYAATLRERNGHREFVLTRSGESMSAETLLDLATRWFVLHRPGQVPAAADDAGRFDVHRHTMLVDIETGGPPETLAVFVKSETAHRVADELNAHEVAQRPLVRHWEQRYADLRAEIERQRAPLERYAAQGRVLRRELEKLLGEVFGGPLEISRWATRLDVDPTLPPSADLQLLKAYIEHLRREFADAQEYGREQHRRVSKVRCARCGHEEFGCPRCEQDGPRLGEMESGVRYCVGDDVSCDVEMQRWRDTHARMQVSAGDEAFRNGSGTGEESA